MGKDELAIRLKERISIYRESPSVTVTYVDLAQICELMLLTLGSDKELGFKEAKA